MIIWLVASLITGYAIGCLHGSLAAQLFSGTNIKKEGVKNSGASNAAIVLGWKYGVLVAFMDIFKSFFCSDRIAASIESGFTQRHGMGPVVRDWRRSSVRP